MDPIQTEIAVLGAGPGGYAAAFHAADLGRRVVIVESSPRLGGVCLNAGCIPSKALLHATHAITTARESAHRGINFGAPQVDLVRLRAWKESVLTKLGAGIAQLAKARGVQVVTGTGRFTGSQTIVVQTASGEQTVRFQHAIIATGSRPALPALFDIGSPRVMTSTEALEVPDIPARLLVIGGGYIGMELATVFALLGSRIVVAEALGSILGGADADLSRLVLSWARKHLQEVRLKARVTSLAAESDEILVTMEFDGKTIKERYDRVLVAVGRTPNTNDIGLEASGVTTDANRFISVDASQRTSSPNIFAIGDAAGGVLLAHKAAHEARVAVECLTGPPPAPTRAPVIPAVVFTDPEVAWCGLTEAEAAQRGIAVEVTRFQWGASGRAQAMDRPDGLTKLILEPKTQRVLGVGIAGHGAGELIAEGVLAVEMGATARDLGRCVHPHPTLSETLMESAEAFWGHSTHTIARKRAG